MRPLNQELLRTVLPDARFWLITKVGVFQGSLNESLAHPREIFRTAILHAAFALLVVHNPGDPSPSEADMLLNRRSSEGAKILQIQLLDHVVVGSPTSDKAPYFCFKEAGALG
jgi:DNA repair protein RadC